MHEFSMRGGGLKKKVKSNLKKMCISVYSVNFFQKIYDVIKLCDKLKILKL